MKITNWKTIICCATLISVAAFAADSRKEFKYTVGNGASINVVNQFGSISLKPSSGNQVIRVEVPGDESPEFTIT